MNKEFVITYFLYKLNINKYVFNEVEYFDINCLFEKFKKYFEGVNKVARYYFYLIYKMEYEGKRFIIFEFMERLKGKSVYTNFKKFLPKSFKSNLYEKLSNYEERIEFLKVVSSIITHILIENNIEMLSKVVNSFYNLYNNIEDVDGFVNEFYKFMVMKNDR